MKLASITRYPIKSLPGEALARARVTERGIEGDRARALFDVATNTIVSAKDPRRYPGLLSLTAGLDDAAYSRALGREVRLVDSAPPGTLLRRAHTLMDANPDGATEDVFAVLAPGTLFDAAPIHLVTTSSLRAVQSDARRFRPNLVIETDEEGLLENAWQSVRIGDVELRVLEPTPRCIVPSLEQHGLPADTELLRKLVAKNRLHVPSARGTFACLGVYALVVKAGEVRVGDDVSS